MWVKVLKPFGSALEGEVLEVRDDGQHQTLIGSGLIEKTEAPKVEEVKPVTVDAYSTANVLKGKTGSASPIDDLVGSPTLEALDNLKGLAADLVKKETEYEASIADFEKAKADFDAEKLAFENEKADFEKAKADFASTSTQTIVEPAKGKPGPKAKEDKK